MIWQSDYKLPQGKRPSLHCPFLSYLENEGAHGDLYWARLIFSARETWSIHVTLYLPTPTPAVAKGFRLSPWKYWLLLPLNYGQPGTLKVVSTPNLLLLLDHTIATLLSQSMIQRVGNWGLQHLAAGTRRPSRALPATQVSALGDNVGDQASDVSFVFFSNATAPK